FIVEIAPGNKAAFEKTMSNCRISQLGTMTADGNFTVTGLNGNRIINTGISDLKNSWQAPLKNF
ncbi:hypothetical protein KAH55_01925, partial [bacterium]|nr:hypothetical protein [bacterium]